MHPAHYKPRHQPKTNSVYLCAVVTLAICLVVSFRCWKKEVSDLTVAHAAEVRTLQVKYAEEEKNSQKQRDGILELEKQISEHKMKIASLSGSLEKEAGKSAELQRKADTAMAEYGQLEQSKLGSDAKVEKCEKEKMEQIATKDEEIKQLKTELDDVKAKSALMSTELRQAKNEVQTEKAEKTETSTKATIKGEQTEATHETETDTVTHVEKGKGSDENKFLKNKETAPVSPAATGTAAKSGTVTDPLHLSAPDKLDVVAKRDEEETIVFNRQGVDAAKVFKTEDEESKKVNSRTGNAKQDQVDTLKDALLIETQGAVTT